MLDDYIKMKENEREQSLIMGRSTVSENEVFAKALQAEFISLRNLIISSTIETRELIKHVNRQ